MWNRASSTLKIAALAVVAIAGAAGPGSARNRTLQQQESDPCAAPRAYVQDHIRRIRALQESTPNKSSLFDMFADHSDFEARRSMQISQLRYDAEGVNALLEAGGCQAFDIDSELR